MSRKMKDSGIDWIGEIPEEWEVRRIKTISTCRENKLADNSGTDYFALENIVSWNGSYIHTDSIYDTTGAIICKTGDIAFGKLRPYLAKVFQIEHDRCCSSEFAVFGDFLGFSRYYFYIMLTNGFVNSVDLSTYGVKMPRANIDYIKNMFVPIPSYNEQQHISGYLDRQCTHIDNIIEKTKTSIEEYKKLKQAVITQAVTKGIRGNREMKDSGIDWIGEIPKSFSTRKLKTFCDVISKGTTPKEMETAFSEKFSIRFIKSENIINNNLSEVPMFTISEETHLTLLQRSILNERDILFVIAGASIGKCAIMNKILLPANTNQATCFIRVKSSLFEYIKYIWYVLQTDIMKTYISLFSVQSAQPNISMEDLGNFVISLPNDKTEIKDIISYLDKKCTEIDAIITKKQQFITEMENYKKSLIFECVTGKREVSV